MNFLITNLAQKLSLWLLFFILLLCFMISSTFIALRLKPGIIPDEVAHTAISNFFSKTWEIPQDTLETLPNGIMSQRPFLFYWINARVINLINWFNIPIDAITKLITLRLLGVLFSSATIVFCFLLSKEFINNP